MFRSKLVLASLIAVFLACSQVQAAGLTLISWDGDAGDHLWSNASNWNPNHTPDNGGGFTYDVTIDANGGYVEVGLTDDYTINQLDCKNGEVDLESWGGWHQLTLLEAGLKNFDVLQIEEIEINGYVLNYAVLNYARLELCDMEIGGNLANASGAWMGVEDEVCVDGTLDNVGTIEIVPMSQLYVEGLFWNFDSGTILMHGGECGADGGTLWNQGVIRGFGVLYGGQDVRNYNQMEGQGQIIASGGSLVIACEGTLINTSTGLLRNEPLASLQIKPWLHTEPADVNNRGLIQVNAGGGVAFDCNLVNDSGGIIELRGGTLAATGITQTADAGLFAGFGTITSQMGIWIETDAEIELTGPTNIIGNVGLDSGATLVISAGQTLITGQTTNNGTIVLAGGTVIFQGGYSGSGEVVDGAPTTGIIIDNGDEGTSSAGSWKVSSVAGFYDENSLYSTTNGDSYSFEAWVLGAREVSLWWTAHSGRSDSVSVEIYDGGDLLDTVIVNQRINGGQWNVLGTYSFSNKAKVKIISGGGDATVADAVKFAPASDVIIDNGDEGTSYTGTWRASSVSGFYGSNSLYSTEVGATYSFEARVLTNSEVSLWWTAHPGRSDSVSVEIYDGGGLLDTVTVNQQGNGGKWNILGTYSFSDNAKVKIISGGGDPTVADAVKFAPL